LYYLKFILGYRAIGAGSGFVTALGVLGIEHQMAALPFGYVIFDAVYSVLMLAMILPAGWKMTALHLLASSAWLAAAWQVAGLIVAHSL